MWLLAAFISAFLLGFYDVFKKQALDSNAVIPVLFLNTLFSSLIFIPLILLSAAQPEILKDTLFFIPLEGIGVHRYIFLKSCIVLSSWLFGYFGMKHLPLTIVGPVNTTRPMMVLLGALVIFGERLNPYQWAGVTLAIVSFFMLGRSGRREGIDFRSNKWILFVVISNILGAASGLYDKYLLAPPVAGGIGLDRMVVQSWFNIYQLFMMAGVLMILWYPNRRSTTMFSWSWFIPCISIFLTSADFIYFYSLSLEGSMISIVSMIRRSSVLVSFIFGVVILRESNTREKFTDLLLLFAGLVFLYLGSK